VPDCAAWDPGVLIVNRAEQFVGVPSWYGRRVGGVLLWDRGSYAGVWLRDEVKTGRAHRYRFDGARLEIDWVAEDGGVKPIRVTFER
jgi:hypothetical protein